MTDKNIQGVENNTPNEKQKGQDVIISTDDDNYKRLINDIYVHQRDLTFIYDKLNLIIAEYSNILREEIVRLFKYFSVKAPLVTLALLGHSGTRKLFGEHLTEILESRELSNAKMSIYSDYQKYDGIEKITVTLKKNGRYTIKTAGQKYILLWHGAESDNTYWWYSGLEFYDGYSKQKVINARECLKIMNGIDVDVLSTDVPMYKFDIYIMEAR